AAVERAAWLGHPALGRVQERKHARSVPAPCDWGMNALPSAAAGLPADAMVPAPELDTEDPGAVTRLAALGRWIIGFAVVGLMLALLWFRSAPPTDLAAVGASPTETPAATQTPTPSPSPTVEATPTPTATPTARPTPAPTPRPTPTDGGAGGPLTGPGTPPPGWDPPPYGPVDVIVTGPFGSSLTSGGMTVTASVLPDEHGGGGCPDSGQKPQPDFVAVGYAVNVR